MLKSKNPRAANPTIQPLSGWGRIVRPGRSVISSDLESDSLNATLFRGLGRSYGDSSLPSSPQDIVVSTPLADKIRFFDRDRGILRAEAGLSLYTLNQLYLREGWFVPVSPGTQFVTLGGMVAGDVHGKNHHIDGCFGQHVESLKLRVTDGRIIECSLNHEPELFRATIGGMGLTGHILEVEFKMVKISSPWIWCESRQIDGIEAFITALKLSARDWPFTVGWIDCLSRGKAMGRGILMCGRWATAEESSHRKLPELRTSSVPFVFPEFVLNPLTVRIFNTLYFHAHGSGEKRRIVHPEKFFYPLDAVRDWNRIYGKSGFTQYQCVIPEKGDGDVTRRFFELLTRIGGASFLCVIKDCGVEGRGMISFPKPGISIALDIPIRANTQDMVDQLNAFVADVGGRIYLCKDTFTRPEHFRAMEPRLDQWMAIRRKWDPEGKIKSAQSVRLFGDKP
jgi:decaprenylphospho-beta-D-ribofuranose 2-oxidase